MDWGVGRDSKRVDQGTFLIIDALSTFNVESTYCEQNQMYTKERFKTNFSSLRGVGGHFPLSQASRPHRPAAKACDSLILDSATPSSTIERDHRHPRSHPRQNPRKTPDFQSSAPSHASPTVSHAQHNHPCPGSHPANIKRFTAARH